MKFKSERFGICDSSGRGGRRGRWEDNIREWTGPEFGKSRRAVENGEKMEKTGCKIICDAPTTLAVKGLVMMMMAQLVERCTGNPKGAGSVPSRSAG